MAAIDEATIHEMLKLAHRLPSPRSAMDTTSIEQTDATNINLLAINFVHRILELAIPTQQHCYYVFALRQDHIAYAIELFIKFDITGYRHSYMFYNQSSDESSADSEWDMNDEEDSEEDSDDELVDDDSEISDDASYNSDGDIILLLDLDTTTPTFDACFEPIEKRVNLSNDDFERYVASQILQSEMNNNGIDFEDDALTMLKMAMYSYVVAKLRSM
jgi:hypothetical protein